MHQILSEERKCCPGDSLNDDKQNSTREVIDTQLNLKNEEYTEETDDDGSEDAIRNIFDKQTEEDSDFRDVQHKGVTIQKCCKKGEQLDRFISRCIKRPGYEVEDIEHETLNVEDAYWSKFYTERKYNVIYDKSKTISLSGPISLMKITNASQLLLVTHGDFQPLRKLIPTLPQYENETLKFKKPTHYCFDAVEDGPFSPHVLVKDTCEWYNCIAKCCFPGELLSEDGKCITYSARQLTSYFFNEMNSVKDSRVLSLLPAMCMKNSFQTKLLSDFEKEKDIETLFVKKFHNLKTECADWQKSNGDSMVLVAGTCWLVSTAALYERLRSLGVVTTALLLAAALAATATGKRRAAAHQSSTHARALCRHALSLAAASGLQTISFYASEGSTRCIKFLLPMTYFFMLAGNFWLSAITINMVQSFRLPLGALAKNLHTRVAARSGSGWCSRFTLLSIYAWGCPFIFSAVTVFMFEDDNEERETLLEEGTITPTYVETRLCSFMTNRSRSRNKGGTIPWEPLYFFYVPLAVLVVINFCCVLFVAWRMRQLKKDNTVLQSNNIRTITPLRSAMVYVKLLLMAGLVELILEILSWTVGSKDDYPFDLYYKHVIENAQIFTMISILVDLIRSIIVLWLSIRAGPQNVCSLFESCYLWKFSLDTFPRIIGRRTRPEFSDSPDQYESSNL